MKTKNPNGSTGNTMTAPLRDVLRSITVLLNKTSESDVVARHQIGTHIRTVKGAPDKYGKRGVEDLAKALRVSKTSLYESCTVAEAWSEAEVRGIASKTNAVGVKLGWSHLVALASVTSVEARAAHVEKCLAANLSVRELRSEVQGKTSRAGKATAPKACGLSVHVRRVTAASDALVDACDVLVPMLKVEQGAAETHLTEDVVRMTKALKRANEAIDSVMRSPSPLPPAPSAS